MRTLKKNKQKMYYALFSEGVAVTETYFDEAGVPYELATGETEDVYNTPVEFFGNIAMSGGEAEAQEYGLNLADYEATLVVDKNTLPLTETSLIWLNTETRTHDNGRVDEYSADFRIVKISHGLNVDKYVLQRIVK